MHQPSQVLVVRPFARRRVSHGCGRGPGQEPRGAERRQVRAEACGLGPGPDPAELPPSCRLRPLCPRRPSPGGRLAAWPCKCKDTSSSNGKKKQSRAEENESAHGAARPALGHWRPATSAHTARTESAELSRGLRDTPAWQVSSPSCNSSLDSGSL